MKHRTLTHLLTFLSIALLVGFAATNEVENRGRWMAGDFHQHTYFTDGSFAIDEVLVKGFEYGLTWEANSEHGGAAPRDGQGRFWDDREAYPENPIQGDAQFTEREVEKDGEKQTIRVQEMWRWQSLLEYAYRAIQRVRGENPDKLVATGVEWNVPGHEHCSVGIVAQDSEPIAEFEYRFDRADDDTSGGPSGQWDGKTFNQSDHEKAVAATEWMQENHPDTGWIVFAHPERVSSYTIADFRDFNDAGPTVAFGFEGLPGHQKRENRGSYGERAVGAGTYGGAGWYIAKVGGVWDALLGEGRNWWTFVSSDFHSLSGDFWPGQYAKTWTYVPDTDRDGEYTLADIPDGLRSGNSYCVHGDLIDQLDFRLASGKKSALMGETLAIAKGEPLEVRIRFRSPEKNFNGDKPKVRAVQLIAGEIRERAPKLLDDGKTPNPAYADEENETTRVLELYTESDFAELEDGWYETPSFQIAALDKDMYFRIRGASLPPGSPHETDAQGNPLADAEAITELGLDGAEASWRDLWFYSNPIFVRTE